MENEMAEEAGTTTSPEIVQLITDYNYVQSNLVDYYDPSTIVGVLRLVYDHKVTALKVTEEEK